MKLIKHLVVWALVALVSFAPVQASQVSNLIETMIALGVIRSEMAADARQIAASVREPARLMNTSALGHTTVDTKTFVLGFSVEQTDGSGGVFLIRAVGPGLREFSAAGMNADTELRVYKSGQQLIAFNDDWQDYFDIESMRTYERMVGAFPLKAGSLDSAVIVGLDAGSYTVEVAGYRGQTGKILVEIYALPITNGKG